MVKPPTSFGFSSLDWELCTQDNAAVAISFTCFLVSVCIALSGARIDVLGADGFWVRVTVLVGKQLCFVIPHTFADHVAADALACTRSTCVQPRGAQMNVVDAVTWTLVAFAMLAVANFVNDKVLLANYVNTGSLQLGNRATAIVEGSSFIGTGTCLLHDRPRLSRRATCARELTCTCAPDGVGPAVIVRASVSGEGTEGGILEDLAVSGLFFLLGQLVLFAVAYLAPVRHQCPPRPVRRVAACAGVARLLVHVSPVSTLMFTHNRAGVIHRFLHLQLVSGLSFAHLRAAVHQGNSAAALKLGALLVAAGLRTSVCVSSPRCEIVECAAALMESLTRVLRVARAPVAAAPIAKADSVVTFAAFVAIGVVLLLAVNLFLFRLLLGASADTEIIQQNNWCVPRLCTAGWCNAHGKHATRDCGYRPVRLGAQPRLTTPCHVFFVPHATRGLAMVEAAITIALAVCSNVFLPGFACNELEASG